MRAPSTTIHHHRSRPWRQATPYRPDRGEQLFWLAQVAAAFFTWALFVVLLWVWLAIALAPEVPS